MCYKISYCVRFELSIISSNSFYIFQNLGWNGLLDFVEDIFFTYHFKQVFKPFTIFLEVFLSCKPPTQPRRFFSSKIIFRCSTPVSCFKQSRLKFFHHTLVLKLLPLLSLHNFPHWFWNDDLSSSFLEMINTKTHTAPPRWCSSFKQSKYKLIVSHLPSRSVYCPINDPKVFSQEFARYSPPIWKCTTLSLPFETAARITHASTSVKFCKT